MPVERPMLSRWSRRIPLPAAACTINDWLPAGYDLASVGVCLRERLSALRHLEFSWELVE